MAWAARVEAGLKRLWWRSDPDLLANLLRPLSWCYGAVVFARRMAYRLGWFKVQSAPVPVVVVGNLVAGGAGKTPTVIALVLSLRDAGFTPGVISRGHGRRSTALAEVHDSSLPAEVGDEPVLIRRRTRAPVWVAARRIEAARALCAAHTEVDVLVADDGLQHAALARAVQVIVFDDRGIGNGLLLPAGPLRQRMPRHVPVNTHVLYNARRATTGWSGALARRALAGAVLLSEWWSGHPATLQALRALQGRQLLAVAGMSAPERFFGMVRDAGLQINTLPLPDHHDFAELPWPQDGAEVLVTEKDAVKLPRHGRGSTRVWVVALDFQFPEDFTAAVLHNLRLSHRP